MSRPKEVRVYIGAGALCISPSADDRVHYDAPCEHVETLPGGIVEFSAANWTTNLHVPRRATVRVRSHRGDITLRELAGHVVVASLTGALTAVRLDGPFRLLTQHGPITAVAGRGGGQARTDDGCLTLTGFAVAHYSTCGRFYGRGEPQGPRMMARTENGMTYAG